MHPQTPNPPLVDERRDPYLRRLYPFPRRNYQRCKESRSNKAPFHFFPGRRVGCDGRRRPFRQSPFEDFETLSTFIRSPCTNRNWRHRVRGMGVGTAKSDRGTGTGGGSWTVDGRMSQFEVESGTGCPARVRRTSPTRYRPTLSRSRRLGHPYPRLCCGATDRGEEVGNTLTPRLGTDTPTTQYSRPSHRNSRLRQSLNDTLEPVLVTGET